MFAMQLWKLYDLTKKTSAVPKHVGNFAFNVYFKDQNQLSFIKQLQICQLFKGLAGNTKE